jgi:hypothetical protein
MTELSTFPEVVAKRRSMLENFRSAHPCKQPSSIKVDARTRKAGTFQLPRFSLKSAAAFLFLIGIGGPALAQEKGTLAPKPLPPLSNPGDPALDSNFGTRTIDRLLR